MKHPSIILLTLMMLCATAAQAAKVYKWVDADGRVHYESTPPPVDQYQTLDIKEPPPSPKPERHFLDDKPAADVSEGDQPNTENLQPDREEIDRKRREVMRYNCAAARKNKMTLISFRRIEIPDGQGGKRRLTEEERDAKLREAEQQIKEFCKGN